MLKSFFEQEALRAWWGVSRSIAVPRVLGPYVLQWPVTDFRDNVLGRLGGVFHGTIMEFLPDKGFFVGNTYWMAPDGDPIGPMALEVACTPTARRGLTEGPLRLRLTQSGYEDGVRWRQYYEVVAPGYTRALTTLKSLIEK